MHELMKQVRMMDEAIARWESIKEGIGEISTAIPSDTRAYLEEVLEELNRQKSQEVAQFTQQYQAELEEKFAKEQREIESSIRDRYQKIADKVVMSLLTSMHEVR